VKQATGSIAAHWWQAVITAVTAQGAISDCYNKLTKGKILEEATINWGDGDNIGKQQWQWSGSALVQQGSLHSSMLQQK